MVTPSYMLAIAEEMERQGIDPRGTSLAIGIFGAEPWTPAMREAIEAKLELDAIDIYGLSEVIGPGVAQECIETKDGLTVWEDHFYPEIIDPETGARAARRREGRARLHVAHQGSAADHPLPHARPDAASAADRARDAADGEDHRPHRRHDDHPRRQRVPDADRGADPEAAGARAALPDRDHAPEEPRRDGRARRALARRRLRRRRGRGRAPRAPHQDHDRRHRRRARAGAGRRSSARSARRSASSIDAPRVEPPRPFPSVAPLGQVG